MPAWTPPGPTAAGFEPHTLVIHPGIGKTATSAIQAAGLALPTNDRHRACFSPFGVLGGAHNAFASVHPMFDRGLFERSIEQLILFVRQRTAATVISSEFLMRDNRDHIATLLHRLSDAGVSLRVMFGIREYDSFLMSAYMQAIKVQWGMKENETLAEYAARELPLMRYPELIATWADHVGDAAIHLLDYDRNRARFLALFFESIGLSPGEVPHIGEERNRSLPIQASEIIRDFDAVCADAAARKRLLDELLNLHYKPDSAEPFRQLVGGVTRACYAEDHAALSRRYRWIGEDGGAGNTG